VLDAAANVEELRALRSDLHVERLDVDDAGDTRRVLFFAKNATRTSLRDIGQRRELLDLWLTAVLEELTRRDAKRPVFIAYKALVPELRAHPALAAWCEEDGTRTVKFAHYGALRGSNRFRRRDAVVTLGDPWLNGDDVTGRAEWLDLDEPSYRIALATAELGQAHGRSRSVRRRRRLTLVHVGRLVPDGWGPGAHVEPLGGPPERSRGTAERIEFAALVGTLGGNRAAAALLGCSSSAVANWRGGSRGLPRDVLERVRALVTPRSKRPASSGEAGRGAPAARMDTAPCIKNPRDCVHEISVVAALPAEEAVGASAEERFKADEQLSWADRLSPEKIEISPLRGGAFLDGQDRAAGGLASERVTSPIMETGSRFRSAVVRVVPFSLADRESVALNALCGARAIAMLEGISSSVALPPFTGGRPGLAEEERAFLAEAQARARRRYGIESDGKTARQKAAPSRMASYSSPSGARYELRPFLALRAASEAADATRTADASDDDVRECDRQVAAQPRAKFRGG